MSLHISFYKDMFSGRKHIVKDEREILIRAARISDVTQIACLLKSIQIREDNLNEKLSINNEDSFIRKGGFFVIWNTEEIARFIHDKKNLILVAVFKNKGKEVINAFLWCRLSLDSIFVREWKLDNELLREVQINKYNTALENNLICTAVECVVHPNGQGYGISYSIIYEMYNWLRLRGFLYSVLQVYRILGEYKDGCFVKGELPNEASINHIKKYGAVCIKKASIPDQTVGNRIFRVCADVFLLDLENAVKRLRELKNCPKKQEWSGTGGNI